MCETINKNMDVTYICFRQRRDFIFILRDMPKILTINRGRCFNVKVGFLKCGNDISYV
jgi:hypothetical protein